MRLDVAMSIGFLASATTVFRFQMLGNGEGVVCLPIKVELLTLLLAYESMQSAAGLFDVTEYVCVEPADLSHSQPRV